MAMPAAPATLVEHLLAVHPLAVHTGTLRGVEHLLAVHPLAVHTVGGTTVATRRQPRAGPVRGTTSAAGVTEAFNQVCTY